MNGLMSRSGLFDDFFRDVAPGFFVKPLHGDPLPAQIRVDIKEADDAYTVQAEIPGVPKEDIHVTIDDGGVTLSAEVKQLDRRAEEEKTLRCERYFGSVSRSFQLPSGIDSGKATAKYENGVLSLTLPKSSPASGRRLTVE